MEEKKDIDSQMTESLEWKLKSKLVSPYGMEVERRVQYRSEFIRRSAEFLKFKAQVEEVVDHYISKNKKELKEGKVTLVQSALNFFPHNPKKALRVLEIIN